MSHCPVRDISAGDALRAGLTPKDGGRGRMSPLSQQVITWPRLPVPALGALLSLPEFFMLDTVTSRLPKEPAATFPSALGHVTGTSNSGCPNPKFLIVPSTHVSLPLFSLSSSNQLTQHLGGHRVLLILQLTVCISYPEYFCGPLTGFSTSTLVPPPQVCPSHMGQSYL